MTPTRYLAVALTACTLLGAAESKTFDKTVPLPHTGSVTIEGHNGSITVNTWDRAEVEIHARIVMSANSGFQDADRRRFDETRVDIDSFANSLRIKSVYPDWTSLSLNGNNPEIHYTIRAPRTARWSVRDHNSRIEVNDLQAALDISTHNSHVIVQRLAGPFTLDTHNGEAKIQFAAMTGSSRVEMHNGDIELTLPKSSKFNLETSSHNGQVESEFPIATYGAGGRRSKMDGVVNGGGPTLRLSSHNGNFRLRAI